jgi:hypothetical protein
MEYPAGDAASMVEPESGMCDTPEAMLISEDMDGELWEKEYVDMVLEDAT